eukprot:8941222-Alexandrium_andersonii.AAC.1
MSGQVDAKAHGHVHLRSMPACAIWLPARQEQRLARIADWRIADWSLPAGDFAPSDPLEAPC